MKGESYFRQLDQHRGSHRPAIARPVLPQPSVAQPQHKRRRDPIDVALKVAAAVLIWAGVFAGFMALYAGIIRLFGGK